MYVCRMDRREQLKQILKSRKLHITSCRLHVLGLCMTADGALTQRALEKKLSQYDRVTLYRTLNSFLESGIIHKIPNSEGSAAYGKCLTESRSGQLQHNHIHFKCNTCGQILCLEDQPIPQISLPEGYLVESANMIIDGCCLACS